MPECSDPLHVKMAPPCYIGTTYSQNLVQYAIMMIGGKDAKKKIISN